MCGDEKKEKDIGRNTISEMTIPCVLRPIFV